MNISKSKNTYDRGHKFECEQIIFDTHIMDLLSYKRIVQISNRINRALGIEARLSLPPWHKDV